MEQQNQTSQQQANQQAQIQQQSVSSYFRQPEPPYFHTPTPPVSAQGQESPYGTFGQLGNQLGHQAQGSHVGAFGGEYGYADTQRVCLVLLLVPSVLDLN